MSISSIINNVPSFTQGQGQGQGQEPTNPADEFCYSSFYNNDCNNNNTCNANKRKQDLLDNSQSSSSLELTKKRRTEGANNEEGTFSRRKSIDMDVLLAFGALCVPVVISNQERQKLLRKDSENENDNESSSDTNTPSQESPTLTPSGTPPSSPLHSSPTPTPTPTHRKTKTVLTRPSPHPHPHPHPQSQSQSHPSSPSNHITEFFENQWQARFLELKHYKEKFSHTNVTRTAKEWKSLGNWVAEQRRKFRKGKMPQDQYDKLDSIGFEWDRKYYFNPGQCKNY